MRDGTRGASQVLDAVLLPEGHVADADDATGPEPARTIYPAAEAPLPLPSPAAASAPAVAPARSASAIRAPHRRGVRGVVDALVVERERHRLEAPGDTRALARVGGRVRCSGVVRFGGFGPSFPGRARALPPPFSLSFVAFPVAFGR